MNAEAVLRRGLAELCLAPSDEAVAGFLLYMRELARWGRTHNLTALTGEREVVVRHFLDSALYLRALGDDVSTVADVGSGAGFPGLPIKMLRPALRVLLIEPARKKAAFLRHAVRRLGLEGVEVIERRAQDVQGVEADAALTRALFSAREFYALAGRIVRPGGVLVLSKGPKAEEELRGLEAEYEVIEAVLPEDGAVRRLVIIRNAG